MLKMKDVIAYERDENGKDIFLPYHGYKEKEIDLDAIEKNGEWLSPYNGLWGRKIVFKKNCEFYKKLRFDGFERGCSSTQAVFIDVETEGQEWPSKYYMFVSDLAQLIKTIGDVSTLSGTFTYTKRGQNYAIILLKEDEYK